MGNHRFQCSMCISMKGLALAFTFGVGLLRFACNAGGVQDSNGGAALFDAAIDRNRWRSAGIFHSYEFEEISDTPPPNGYRPIYLSHYGRHGSRFQRDAECLKACAVMEKAEKAGLLSPSGKALLQRIRPVAAVHEGMYESLSLKGAQEHARLATRMYGRFPGVFSHGGKVRCQSSVFHRCLLSMANFTCALKGEATHLEFSFETGDKYMSVMLGKAPGVEERRAKMNELDERILHEMVFPDRLMRLLFRDLSAAREATGDPHRFVADLFAVASACDSLKFELGGLDIFDCFTRDELLSVGRYMNFRYFEDMGNSEEFGVDVVQAAAHLAEDIVKRADNAIAKGVCADLRFGHDVGLMPLVGLMGLNGAGDRVPAAESWRTCPLWRCMPMAANIQIVLYENDGGEQLAKVLFNEREAGVRGLEPKTGPYYRWSDLRTRLLRK